MNRLAGCFFVLLVLFGNSINAGLQQAHVHGQAMLMIAYEHPNLEIMFESPAMNILGFEHQAKSESEKDIISKTEKVLESENTLFSFTGSQCELGEAIIDVASDKDNSHDHHHHHHDHETDGHSEVSFQYQFVCDSTNKLTAISTDLFEQFSGIQAIQAQWITSDKQGSVLLNVEHNIVELK